MTRNSLTLFIQCHWHLVFVMVLAAFVAVAAIYKGVDGMGAAEASSVSSPSAPYAEAGIRTTDATRTRLTTAEKARATIEEYEARLITSPPAEEQAALLYSIGNLCRQKLLDYRRAAWHYDRIVHQFPDWRKCGDAYVNLARCYEELDERESARLVYLEMMRNYSETSPYHQYAREQLGL